MPVLVPVPKPAYTLAPTLPVLTPGQRAALETCLEAFTGRVGSVVVTAAGTTLGYHVLELMTTAGAVMVIERIRPDDRAGRAAQPSGASTCDNADGASTGSS